MATSADIPGGTDFIASCFHPSFELIADKVLRIGVSISPGQTILALILKSFDGVEGAKLRLRAAESALKDVNKITALERLAVALESPLKFEVEKK